MRDDSGDRDEDDRSGGADRGERDRSLRAPERQDDERNFEPFEQHPLERHGECVPVEACTRFVSGCARFGDLVRECLLFVVQRLVPARAQDCFPQPLQTEHEQQSADDKAQRVDRDHRERRTERGDDRSECNRGYAYAGQR